MIKKPILASEIALRFHPSTFLWGWWVIFSIMVMTALTMTLSAGWAVAVAMGYLLACLWHATQLVAMPWGWSVHHLRIDVFGQAAIMNRHGQWWRIHILPDSVVHARCLVLHIAYLEPLEDAGAVVPLLPWLTSSRLLILFDQAESSSQQALRVWLKWGLREQQPH